MMSPSPCDHSDTYILVQRTLKIAGTKSYGTIRNEEVTFENFVPLTDYISKMNNT